MLGVDIAFNWAGFAAVLTAIAGIMAAYAALVRAKRETRKEADDDCTQKLLEARRAAISASDELYQLRMKRDPSRDERPEEIIPDRTLADW
jgi:hypothetical protein